MKSHESPFECRIVVSDADLQICADIRAEMRPDRITSVEEMRAHDAALPDGANQQRHIFTEAGENVVSASTIQSFWTPETGLYDLWINTRRQISKEFADQIMSEMTSYLRSIGATKVNIWMPTHYSTVIDSILDAGFKMDQSNPESRLDLSSIDLDQFEPAIRRLLESDLRLVSLKELMIEDPTNALRRYYELDNRLTKDIPLPWEFTGEPYENFEKGFLIEQHTFDTIQVVLDGDFMVGTSMLFRNKFNPIYYQTGLTGVDRGYRRRGIATALKAINFKLAKEKGGKFIMCDNEENNPMLQLNYQLGFKPIYVTNSYTKILS